MPTITDGNMRALAEKLGARIVLLPAAGARGPRRALAFKTTKWTHDLAASGDVIELSPSGYVRIVRKKGGVCES